MLASLNLTFSILLYVFISLVLSQRSTNSSHHFLYIQSQSLLNSNLRNAITYSSTISHILCQYESLNCLK